VLVYVNGTYCEPQDATISVFDRGFLLGDAAFETWRTYGARQVAPMVDKHLERLRRTLNFMEMDGDELVGEIRDVAAQLVARNLEEIESHGDVWIVPVVTRGGGGQATPASLELGGEDVDPTRVVLIRPIYIAAGLYERGARLLSSTLVQNPFAAADARVKSTSRMAYIRAERKQHRAGPGCWTLLFDRDGYVTEAAGANIVIIDAGEVIRPPRWAALNGVSLSTFCELAQRLGMPVREQPLGMYDLLNADEVWLTSTSVSAVAVADIDGITLRRRTRRGDQVLKAWVEYVGFDFIEQVRDRSDAAEPLVNAG
jgi:branched-chain amino acid aminotransferase